MSEILTNYTERNVLDLMKIMKNSDLGGWFSCCLS